MTDPAQPLPIDAVLGALRAALASNARAVLVAPSPPWVESDQ